MKNHLRLLVLLVLNLSKIIQAKIPEVSPCPRLFTYEGGSAELDRWYGIITLLSTSDLNGIWLRIIFDKPIVQLGNWFGEVDKKGKDDYLIKNPSFSLKAHTAKTIRIFVRYDTHKPAPLLTEFRINGKVVCPEDLVTTTPSTTTEHLFTNSADDFQFEATSPITMLLTTSTSPLTNVDVGLIKNRVSNEIQHSDLDEESICGTVVNQHQQPSEQLGNKVLFPWHVSIYYSGIIISYLCAASLITKQHIITAAHCTVTNLSSKLVDPERLIVYLGKHNVKHRTPGEGVQTRLVAEIIIHPNFDPVFYSNDISVIKLLETVDFTETVRPVCLWKGPADRKISGTIVGWSFDAHGKIDDELSFVHMNIQATSICYKSPLGNYILRRGSNNTFCANFVQGTKKCVGDSGGGMVFPRLTSKNLIWQLRGVISISVALQRQTECDQNHYAIFTDTTQYLDWIKEMIHLKI